MKTLEFGISRIVEQGPAYMIAEIGHNHQGSLETALQMVRTAAQCGVQAVKFQKRDNRALFTKAYFDRPYDNENSYGATYGEHREFLELGRDAYVELMACAREHKVEFMATVFDFPSVDLLEGLGLASYKIASADVTNVPLIEYVARTGKPVFISTGASSLDEDRRAYEAVLRHHDKVCLLHCTAGYPTEYADLNLRAIETMKKEFPRAMLGYSGHDNGILASSMAYMLGATVIEKHFTMNHAWKGTDHKFSLEPEGMRKQVRDLARITLALGDGRKELRPFERDARAKMGKSIYAARPLAAGTVLDASDLCLKTPGGGLPPYRLPEVVGRRLRRALAEEELVATEDLETDGR